MGQRADWDIVQAKFGTGRELLAAYWGYLAHGGLVVPTSTVLPLGTVVRVEIHLESQDVRYSMTGTVVAVRERGKSLVVAFLPGQPHHSLVADALVDTDGVPPREFRRFGVDLSAQCSIDGGKVHEAVLVNLSKGGLCVRCDVKVEQGARAAVFTGAHDFGGEVVWQRDDELGIRLDPEHTHANTLSDYRI